MLPIDFIYEHIEDEHGVYETGMFTYKGKDILINKEMGEWHLSVSANHTLGYSLHVRNLLTFTRIVSTCTKSNSINKS